MSEPQGKLYGMDPAAQQAFARYFRSLPEKSEGTVRFFNRGDYYSCHGTDALYVAQEVFKTTSVCKSIRTGSTKLDCVSLNKSQFEAFVRELLLIKQHRVEVYADKGSGRNKEWAIECKGSPGNLWGFENILFGNNLIVSGLIMSLKLGTEGKTKIVGLSCVDPISTIISVSQFVDDESFSNLEAIVVANAPKECLLIQGENSTEYQTIKMILERNNVLITPRKKAEFDSASVIQDLNSLIKFKKGQEENAAALPETNLPYAMSATASIIQYLDLTSDDGNIHQYKIEELEQSRFLKLDAAAIDALNIECRNQESYQVINNDIPKSIQTLLDRCRTSAGHRLMAQWVRRPLRDLALIKERHDIVEFLLNHQDLRSVISEEHLKLIPDLEQLAKKLARKKARLQDCYRIYQCVSSLPNLAAVLAVESMPAALKAIIIKPLEDYIEEMNKFQQMIDETLDFDAVENNEYFVKPDFNDDLKELHQEIQSIRNKIEAQLPIVAEDLHMEAGKKIKLETNQIHGYYFRVTLKDDSSLQKKKNYTILESIKNGIKFRNAKMQGYNERYFEVKEKYETEQNTIVAEVISIAASYCSTIKSISSIVAILDVLNSFALVAANARINYVRPEMLPSDAGVLKLVEARHPLVECQRDINYIANNIELKRGESQFHIITGPNMGGKSTHMKVAGVAVLLAHIGSFVPCRSATISLHDSILARVGADDSQMKGVSTFQKEMIEITAIIKSATSNSLVLIDELGRGTSTYDGRALAWAIAEYMSTRTQAFCFFATHYHEITKLVENIPIAKNYYVSALTDGDDVTFLYEVKPGICEQSYGIYIAKMANFSADVIEFAKRKQSELEDGQVVKFDDYSSPENKREIINSGDELIEQFINKFKDLDESLPEEVLMKKIDEFKSAVSMQNNPYIAALVE